MREHDFPGKFIVIEGADGAGTTTQSKKLVEELDAYYTFEPTEGLVGRKVDEMISSGDYSADAISLAFAADRLAHLEEEVIPKLESGETVVCDRYYHSSLVYQPALGSDFEWVKKLNRHALTPDLTVILDISADEGLSRVEKRGSDGNIFENLDFQSEVIERYRRLPDRLDEEIHVVSGSDSIEDVFSRVLGVVRPEI